MRRTAALLPLALCALLPRKAGAALADEPRLSPEERAFCAQEVEVVERRRQIFLAQGLSAREVARRNASELRELEDCRGRFRDEARRAREEKEDREELARRTGPDATETERAKAWREIRRERLASRNPAHLDAGERAELAAGMQEEVAATHAALDAANARDPAFMRTVHSALACYHGDRKDELEGQIQSEEALVKLGAGDREKLYRSRSALRRSEAVLARSRDAARAWPGGLDRCSNPTVAVLAQCLAVRFQGRRAEPACDAEEIQQYVRFVK